MSALTINRPGHQNLDTHSEDAGSVTNPPQATATPIPILTAPEGLDIQPGLVSADAQVRSAGLDHTSPQAKAPPTPRANAPAGTKPTLGHDCYDAHNGRAEGVKPDQPATMVRATPIKALSLADPLLYFLAATLDDVEGQRIANENRVRILIRDQADNDGEERGFGLTDDHPTVRMLTGVAAAFKTQEDQVTKALEKAMKAHPLSPWVKDQRGVGLKTAARLLAAVGDPYWNTLHDRPRTVSELWSYSGLRPDAKRQKGQKSNWSSEAKTRGYLIAVSCLKAGGPYADVYRERREHTSTTHPEWTPGHSHNDALRFLSKRILRDLWREAKQLHNQT